MKHNKVNSFVPEVSSVECVVKELSLFEQDHLAYLRKLDWKDTCRCYCKYEKYGIVDHLWQLTNFGKKIRNHILNGQKIRED